MQRMTRLEKYRQKNQLLILISKVVLIGYLMIFSISYLATNTDAYFASPQQVSKVTISAGTWDDDQPVDDEKDESSLVFTSKGNKNLKTCPAMIEVEIKNNGNGPMLAEGSYEIYYIENGNPKKHGEKIDLDEGEGIIKVLESGETAKLTYETSLPGRYIFVAFQHESLPDHEGMWSKEIKVDCKEFDQEQSVDKGEEERDQPKVDENYGEDVGEEPNNNDDSDEVSTEGSDNLAADQEDHRDAEEEKEDPDNADDSANIEDEDKYEEEKGNEVAE